MQIFKIRQDGFKEIKKQMLIRAIPIVIIAAAVGILIGSMNSAGGADDTNVLPFVIPFVALSISFGLYRGAHRQKTLLDSYTLTITNNLIRREQLNTPTISIYLDDVQEIAKHKNGSFTVKGKVTNDFIVIPSQIDNYAQLENTLQDIRTIVSKKNTSFIQISQSLMSILTVGLMLCVYTVNNKIIVALTGTILIALMIWSLAKIINSKNIDNKAKNNAWWIVLVLASVIAVMIIKLSGFVDMQRY